LAVHEIPATQDLLQRSLLEESPTLAHRQLGNEDAHESMAHVVVCAALLQLPIVIGDAAAAAVAVGVVDALRERIEAVHEKAVGHALLGTEGQAVVRIVAEVRVKLDGTELRVRLEAL